MKKTNMSRASPMIWMWPGVFLLFCGCQLIGTPSTNFSSSQPAVPSTSTPFRPPPLGSSSPQPAPTFTITPFRTPIFGTRPAHSFSIQPTATFPIFITLVPATPPSKNAITWIGLAYDEYGTYYEDYATSVPRLMVVTNRSDVDQITEGVREDHIILLKQVDYSKWVPLIIFSGWHGTTGYSILVQNVERFGTMVKVSAEFLSPAPNQTVGPAVTHPYSIIEIQRPNLSGEITFELVLGQQNLYETQRNFPKP